MKEFGLKYAVLINPRYFGWDNSYISYSPAPYPKLFVAHGLINPEDPQVADRLRYWVTRARLSGHALQPAVSSELDVAEFEGALPAVARGGKARRGVQLLHPAAPDADARRHGRDDFPA